MRKFIEVIKNDKEIQMLKKQYEEKYDENPPPYNYDEYLGLDDYKEKLKNLVEAPIKH